MNRRLPTMIRSLVLLLAVAFGAAGCVAYPAGPYGYGYRGGWRAPAYAYAGPHGGWHGGWGYRRW